MLWKIIYTDKSFQDLDEYLNKIDFFKDFISIINPTKYEIKTDTDIESSSVSWPVTIIYEDKPLVPVISMIVPYMTIKQIWNYSNNKINVKIESSLYENKLFEMNFDCIIRYLGDIEIEGSWVQRNFYIPNVVLECVMDQFEQILKKLLK